jgi:hypothetical protein
LPVERRTLIALTLALLIWSVAASYVAVYYFTQYTDTTTKLSGVSVKVNICINYANGTRIWYNNTLVPVGASAFNATVAVVKVESTYYSGIGEFVKSIGGVTGNSTQYWSFWYYKQSNWTYSEVGASAYILHQGDIIGWRYSKVGEGPENHP